jgi:hypothetical protein
MFTDHLSDQELMAALDGELSTRRQAVVEGHVARCLACAARATDLARSAAAATAAVHDSDAGAEPLRVSRARLQAALAEAAGQRRAPWVAPLAAGRRAFPWLGAAAAVALAAVLMRVAGAPAPRPYQGLVMPEDGALPIAALTPGATRSLTPAELCARPLEDRPIPESVRATVLRNYRMERVSRDEYELDYLITPELGGATAAENLWPQRYATRTWNAYVKDQLEQLLPRLVCEGAISLEVAQRDMATNWIDAYKRYFRTDLPLSARAE